MKTWERSLSSVHLRSGVQGMLGVFGGNELHFVVTSRYLGLRECIWE